MDPHLVETFVAIDTETGGLDPQVHPLLTLGIVVSIRRGGGAWEEVYAREFKFPYHGEEVDDKAMAVTGIYLEDHVGDEKGLIFPADIEEVLLDVIPEGATLVGHNVGFDIGFLAVSGVNIPNVTPCILDTYSLATALWGSGTYSARSLASWLRLKAPYTHNALMDARFAMEAITAMLLLLDERRISTPSPVSSP